MVAYVEAPHTWKGLGYAMCHLTIGSSQTLLNHHICHPTIGQMHCPS